MLRRPRVTVWIGIILLSGMFLGGQESWPPEACPDLDRDGYGNPASAECPNPTLDCDDDPSDDPASCSTCTCGEPDCTACARCIHPGISEDDPMCADGVDNDCDGLVDTEEVETCSAMERIPSGCFEMGDPFGEGLAQEGPVHTVCVSAFEIDVHEVTNEAYGACVAAGACVPPVTSSSQSRPDYFGNPAYDDFPVIFVDWYAAAGYCQWAGKRLPTESQAERAFRGGLAGKRYPWGDGITCDEANYGRSSPADPCWDYGGLENDTHAVATYGDNGYGLHDGGGNVLEWVADWFDLNYYEQCVNEGIVNDPPGPAAGTHRVLRGGAWRLSPFYLRVACRSRFAPDYEDNHIGFRCALSGDCIDVDHDGRGNPASGDCIDPALDCDDTNPEIHPAAAEICDNAIDDDCDGLIDTEDADCV